MSEKKITDYNNPKSSLADIILIIAKHLNLILMMTVITTVLTIVYVNKKYVPKYMSSTKMFIPNEGANESDFSKIARQFGITNQASSVFDISSSSLYPEIVSSKTFAEIMLNKEFYTKKFDKKLPLIAIFTYGDRPIPSNVDTLKIAALDNIAGMIKIQLQRGFFIIEVTTEEPQFSRDFADTLISELDKLQRKFKRHTANETIVYIEQKISYAKLELENSEEKLKHFRERNRDINNSPSLLLTQERLQRDVEIQKGIFLTLKQQLELEKIGEIQKSSFVQILDYPSLPLKVINPKKLSTNIIGGSVGFFFAIFLSFMIEYFKNINKIESSKLKSSRSYAFESIKRIFTFKWLKKVNK